MGIISYFTNNADIINTSSYNNNDDIINTSSNTDTIPNTSSNNNSNIVSETLKQNNYLGFIGDLSEEIVRSGSGNDIGKRGFIKADFSSLTNESILNFYNDKIKDSNYNYFTIIDQQTPHKGYVFPGCLSFFLYGDIDNTGAISNSEKSFSINNNSIVEDTPSSN